MSLDWTINKVRDWEEIAMNIEDEGDKTYHMIWMTMVIQLGGITKDNWKDFYARCAMIDILDGNDIYLSPEDVHRRIGLNTNVYPNEGRVKWTNRVARREYDKVVQNATAYANELDTVEVSQ